jgi:2-oxoglutarate ferredoxin oxidoreductase subunit delta
MINRAPILPEPRKVCGTVHIDIERCKGCDLCIDYCPTKILAMSPLFNVKGYHYPIVADDNCIVCHSCFIICPEFAIFATPVRSTDKLPAATL